MRLSEVPTQPCINVYGKYHFWRLRGIYGLSEHLNRACGIADSAGNHKPPDWALAPAVLTRDFLRV